MNEWSIRQFLVFNFCQLYLWVKLATLAIAGVFLTIKMTNSFFIEIDTLCQELKSFCMLNR